MEQQQQNEREVAPRQKPVYIDPVTVYLNEPILYDEWPQAPCEISSSLQINEDWIHSNNYTHCNYFVSNV